jgi:hypothetical protein
LRGDAFQQVKQAQEAYTWKEIRRWWITDHIT